MKDFDLQAAKKGAPVCTLDGRPARILCFDRKDDYYPIVACIDCGHEEDIYSYTDDGRLSVNNTEPLPIDLMMSEDEGSCDNIKRSCINCVWPTRFDSMGTCILRCEENPNVCDHPFCVELEEATSMCCEQFSSTEVCTHCRYMGVNQCNNSKRATFDGDMVVLHHCNYNDKACEFFEREI